MKNSNKLRRTPTFLRNWSLFCIYQKSFILSRNKSTSILYKIEEPNLGENESKNDFEEQKRKELELERALLTSKKESDEKQALLSGAELKKRREQRLSQTEQEVIEPPKQKESIAPATPPISLTSLPQVVKSSPIPQPPLEVPRSTEKVSQVKEVAQKEKTNITESSPNPQQTEPIDFSTISWQMLEKQLFSAPSVKMDDGKSEPEPLGRLGLGLKNPIAGTSIPQIKPTDTIPQAKPEFKHEAKMVVQQSSIAPATASSKILNPIGDISVRAEGSNVAAIAKPTTRPKRVSETPYAEEYWNYYFNERMFTKIHDHYGGSKAPAKIRGLLKEVVTVALDPTFCVLSRPVIEEMSDGKIYFVGDTHGSVEDTDVCIRFFRTQIELAKKQGKSLRIIFLGDYVDRNPQDIHNLFYIFAFAVKYPNYVRLIRGNHEEVTINSNYGFRENLNSVLKQPELFIEIEEVFANIPLAHLIKTPKGMILSVHGGIPIINSDYNQMPKIPDIVHEELLDSCYLYIDEMNSLSQQILWNDPANDLPPDTYYLPSTRGLGFVFGEKVFNAWIEQNKVNRVIRGHEMFIKGHREFFNNRLFSVFSSSNYVGRTLKGSILEIDLIKEWEKNWQYFAILDDLPLLIAKALLE